MSWTVRQYSKSKIDAAGAALVSLRADDPQRDAALEVIDNWRSCHGYPLHVVTKRLQRRAKKIYSDVLIARRIKRLPSVKLKLEQQQPMRLSQMQDIGGCRAVMDSIGQIYELAKSYEMDGVGAAAVLHSATDYIASPKQDGYRGIHLIMKYQGRGAEFAGQKIEIQIRSAMQHAWATAIETAQAMRGEAFKSKVKTGSPNWLRFFCLVSGGIADLEGRAGVPGVSADPGERCAELKALENKEHIITNLRLWSEAIKIQPGISEVNPGAFYFLLELNPKDRSLTVSHFRSDEIPRAEESYALRERATESNPEIQLVLVSVDRFEDMRRAYPNFYLDAGKFIEMAQWMLRS
ncbi:MAG TPA: RelA/SpoT domain-containing protein [Tepidisphaeraceae bacterium]|nr:RelA/SpoT domain-containing protein [Tepidisphaeraceae bacterium]